MDGQAVSAELLAVVVAMVEGEPCVLTLGAPPRLPAGPLMPGHRSLQTATRAWVEEQTGRTLGYLEQLYTFAGVDRAEAPGRRISISYLGLTTPDDSTGIGRWHPWYDLLPWEDLRSGAGLPATVVPSLTAWTQSDPAFAGNRRQRCAITFGLDGQPWQPDLVLQRYELLYEVGLLPESPAEWRLPDTDLVPGERMVGDHRRVLATGLARLRAKIQYRPVVFELMAPDFTLRQLQDCVEALAGTVIHTQNFRRLVEQQELVEETGGVDASTGGRPARLYRFRRQVLQQRSVAGTKLPAARVR
ncbi:hypothetical protein GCM10009785_13020 [Brooklawnia cerclae]|uniref:NrtR DNA-binding winged helix domain-containing protein n=1 Tax=Brooklawnia cerclae TaxID=349934 RepID=A0ABX0SK96_9ACTN|nr:hypothetical protein [Brooklawnia cerclae]